MQVCSNKPVWTPGGEKGDLLTTQRKKGHPKDFQPLFAQTGRGKGGMGSGPEAEKGKKKEGAWSWRPVHLASRVGAEEKRRRKAPPTSWPKRKKRGSEAPSNQP